MAELVYALGADTPRRRISTRWILANRHQKPLTPQNFDGAFAGSKLLELTRLSSSPERRRTMVTDRQTEETVARCVSLMVFYQNSEKTKATKGLVEMEVEVIARQIVELGFDTEAKNERVFHPLLNQLLVRYTPNVATSLYNEFLAAYAHFDTNRRQRMVHRG